MSLLRKLRPIFHAQIGLQTIYRAEIMIWMLSGTLSFIMAAIWAGIAGNGEVGGYSRAGIVSYFAGTWVTGQFLVAWVAWELDQQIRLGGLSPKLLRPLDPIWEHLTQHLSERVVRLPFVVLIAALVLLLVPGAHFTSNLAVYPAYLVIVFFAFLVRFLTEYCVGLLCFWTDSATAFSELSWLAYAGLGGTFAPLSLYPEAVQRVAAFTPFPYMLGLPARMLSGRAAWNEVGSGLLVLLGWVCALLALRLLLWRAGVRRYGAVGA